MRVCSARFAETSPASGVVCAAAIGREAVTREIHRRRWFRGDPKVREKGPRPRVRSGANLLASAKKRVPCSNRQRTVTRSLLPAWSRVSSDLSDQPASCQSAFVLLALPAILHALAAPAVDSVPIRINYDAPASCPNQDAFYDALRARTQRVRKAQGNEPRVDVNVRLTRSERRFHGEMREVVNQDETSSRNVDGETCKEVVEALAFTVALSLDPEAHAPVPPEVEPPPAPKPDTLAVPLASPSEAAKTTIPGARLELEIGLSVLGTVVETAGFATGAALSVMLLRETSASKSGAVQLSLLFAGTGLLTAPDDHRTRFGALALDACPFRHRSGSFEIAPCALATLGFLEMTGRGVSEPATVSRAWLSAGIDLQLSWLLGRGVVFEGALGATVPLVRHRYY